MAVFLLLLTGFHWQKDPRAVGSAETNATQTASDDFRAVRVDSKQDAAIRSLYGMGEFAGRTWLEHIDTLDDDVSLYCPLVLSRISQADP